MLRHSFLLRNLPNNPFTALRRLRVTHFRPSRSPDVYYPSIVMPWKAEGWSSSVNSAQSNQPQAAVKLSKRQSWFKFISTYFKMGNTISASPRRQDAERAMVGLGQLIHAPLRPLPTQTGDGTYLPELSTKTGLLKDFAHLNIRDVGNLAEMLKQTFSGGPVDDKTYLMEKIIQVAADLPLSSKNGTDLTNSFLSQLWTDLQHPPLTYLGDKARYRTADGSGNNILWPHIGAANAAYARTAQPKLIQPATLPEPGVVFDSLMVRKEFRPHPNKISSVLFYLASIIIHDLFRTDRRDYNVSATSSYLDLSPLYGSNQEEQDTVRTFEDGRIKNDCFAEKRVLGFPPGCGALLIMFNRFHNYVVKQLAAINEGNRFSKPGKTESEAYMAYDNALFQTGRLITCGLYVNIILKDYVRTILNLNRTNSLWDLDPRVDIRKSDARDSPLPGTGNAVSAEFNLIYRWHSCLSIRDEHWTQDAAEKLYDGKDPAKVSLEDAVKALAKWEAQIPSDPVARPFANLERQADGSFRDDDLVNIMTDSVEDCAGAFGALHVPPVLRAVELLGIQQARSWNLASLNELRAYFGLMPHKTFEDINSDPYIADQLRHLYDHPDFVELYPGVVIEESKKSMVPGSGLCTTFTISRTILSDAVSLVRGDRFYTTDYTPRNLTNWGFNEAHYDLTVDQGCVFYKLFLRAFPHHFKANSIYAHYPMVLPSENKLIMQDLGRKADYSWEKPQSGPKLIFVTSYAACKSILENKADFHVTWGEAIDFLMHDSTHSYGWDFMLSGDGLSNLKSRELLGAALYECEWHQQIKQFYEQVTLELLRCSAYKLAGVNQVDLVRDVGNLAQVHFAAGIFSLPLKSESNPRGVYAESELYLLMALVFTCIFFDVDLAKSFPLRMTARRLTQQLGKLVLLNVELIQKAGRIANSSKGRGFLHDYGVSMIQRLLKSGLSPKEIVFTYILPTAGGMVANQAQLFALCIDYYLSEAGQVHLPEIRRLSKMDTAEADDKLLHYFMEGTRLNALVGVYRDAMKSTTIIDNGREVEIPVGSRVMCDLVLASRDPSAFPQPDQVDLRRDINNYLHYDYGPHQCLGYEMSRIGLTAMLKTVGRLDGLRRAPGPQGYIKQVVGPGGSKFCMTTDQSSCFPFPQSMKVQWDGELPTRRDD